MSKRLFYYLVVALCVFVSSCSEDLMENESGVRSLSKRKISSKEGNEDAPVSTDVYGVEAGSSSGISYDGNFTVYATWTRGYTTRNPYSVVHISVSSNGKLDDCAVESASGSWTGSIL